MQETKFYSFIKPAIPNKLRPFFLKHQELLCYFVFGVLTTAVNYIIYFSLSGAIGYLAANIIAWAGSVIFAFFMNKAFVFEDDSWDAGTLIKQGLGFAGARVFSLVLEEGILFLFADKLGFGSGIVKIAATIVVAIFNYLFSKLVIFRKKRD